MKDNASLTLSGEKTGGKIGSACANIHRVEGQNVKMSILDDATAYIFTPSTFNLRTQHLSSNDDYVKVSGEQINIKG